MAVMLEKRPLGDVFGTVCSSGDTEKTLGIYDADIKSDWVS